MMDEEDNSGDHDSKTSSSHHGDDKDDYSYDAKEKSETSLNDMRSDEARDRNADVYDEQDISEDATGNHEEGIRPDSESDERKAGVISPIRWDIEDDEKERKKEEPKAKPKVVEAEIDKAKR
ncbi:unnamed protein product [Protopolystoma xenopodis]|uniref:Uncharacterized protein n=1 Tax=Protopolystoma xenopodis TaxID=117903 RepID=A0A448X4L4_9PLAT|nr:unnamed protein product [Protopolystoma xenopodis]